MFFSYLLLISVLKCTALFEILSNVQFYTIFAHNSNPEYKKIDFIWNMKKSWWINLCKFFGLLTSLTDNNYLFVLLSVDVILCKTRYIITWFFIWIINIIFEIHNLKQKFPTKSVSMRVSLFIFFIVIVRLTIILWGTGHKLVALLVIFFWYSSALLFSHFMLCHFM